MVEHLGQYDSGVSYKKVIIWFILAAVIICVVALYFVLSRATIYLLPKIETKEVTVEVITDANTPDINYETNTLRGILISEESSFSESFDNIPPKKLEENAKGEIKVHNGYTRAQGFKEGDILVSDTTPEQKVRVTENLIVYRTQTKTLQVEAVEKGVAGHIPPTTFKFEKYDDFMNEKVTAKSETAFSGGIRTANMITEDDINVAKSQLLKKAKEDNAKKISAKLRSGEELKDEYTVDQIIAFHSSVAAPFEADNFKADITVKTTAAIFKKEDLDKLITQKLGKMADTNQEFLDYDESSVSLEIEKISTEEKKAYLKIKIKGRFQPKLSTALFNKDEIKGFNERAVRTYYQNFNELEGVEVKFWPRFRKTVPDIDSRIIIEIKK